MLKHFMLLAIFAIFFSAQAATPEYFAGIVKLSNCSGSLVKYESSLPTDKAMILTNGHCVGDFTKSGRMLGPDQYVHNQEISGWSKYYASINFLNPRTGANMGQAVMQRILYATMTGTDMALLELDETYADLERKYSAKALVISSQRALLNDKVFVVSGYHRKNYHCQVKAIVPELIEDDYHMFESIRYAQGCDTIPGTSGSPILNADLNLVVGVNNTGNESGRMCDMNNPCQKWPGKPDEAVRGRAYGQQINDVYSCLTTDRKIDLTMTGCKLFH